MAKRPKSFSDGFTIQSLTPGSDSGPKNAGKGKAFGGAPTLSPINVGERYLSEDAGSKDIYPPVYGGGNRQITITQKRGRGGKGGYMPTQAERDAGPKPI